MPICAAEAALVTGTQTATTVGAVGMRPIVQATQLNHYDPVRLDVQMARPNVTRRSSRCYLAALGCTCTGRGPVLRH